METLIDWSPEDNKTSRVELATQPFRVLSVKERGDMILQLGREVSDFPKA